MARIKMVKASGGRAQEKAEGASYDEYVAAVAASLEFDFEYGSITAHEFARDDFKDITRAFYSASKDPREAAKEIDAKYMGGNESCKKAEGHDGWDDWEDIEGLEETIEGIENLAYELRNCVRGAKTRCKDWKSLSLYIKRLASNLDDAAELMAYKDDGEDESKKHEDSGVGDMTALIKGVDRAHTKETLPLQAELRRLKEQRAERVKEILGDSVKNYFEDLGYEVPRVYLDWPSVSLTLKGSIDGYYFDAHPEVVLKSAYIPQRSSLNPDYNKVITNYGEKFRRIPLDYNKRFTAQTPKPVQEKYFELLAALKGITKFAGLVEKDPEIQKLNDEIQDVANSIKIHPLLSPGIT